MNNVVKSFLLGVAVAALAFVGEAAPEGSCESAAVALESAQEVMLTNEYDPEWKEYTDSGVYYYKVKLTKGQSCTIWMNGGNTIDMWGFSVDVSWDLEDWPMASFDYETRDDGGTQIAYLYADSWDEEDGASYTFYVCIQGEIGQTCNLYYQNGIKSFTVLGEESNPKRLKVTDDSVKDTEKLIEGEYYYLANLTAGRKYSFRTVGGTASAPLMLDIDGQGAIYDLELDPSYSNDLNNASYLIYPLETADYKFCLFGNVTTGSIKYWSYPVRLPADHDWVELKENGGVYSATGVPGRVVEGKSSSGRSYYDDVIDEVLFKLPSVHKGDRWVFQSAGADRNLEMRIYDASGAILAVNTTMGNGNKDMRTAFEADADGDYYVGVCNPRLAYWDEKPTDPLITVTARRAEDFTGPDDLDELDPGDDTWRGATPLTAVPGQVGMSPVLVGGSYGASPVHVLSGGDWYDWVAIACRSGLTYSVKAAFATDARTDLFLFGKVYATQGDTVVKYNATKGSLSPEGTDAGTMPLVFTADRSGMFYVRITVGDGIGLDYPRYRLYAMVTGDGKQDLGLVSAKTMGLDGTWYFTDAAGDLYASGAEVAVPAGVAKNIRFTADGSYVTPAKQSVVPESWQQTSNAVSVVGWYVDIADPADDARAGAVFVAPDAKERKLKRTLWGSAGHLDAADHYAFDAASGIFYNFWLEDTTGGDAAGDAVFALLDAGGKVLASDLTDLRRWRGEAGRHYVKVAHRNPAAPADTTYRFWYNSANVGVISFASTSVNVAESVNYAEVTVKRSASDGAVRVRYATEAMTAKPGREYYPTDGVLEWADGDSSDKTIRVRLIPDEIATFDEQKKFKVCLWPVPDDGLEDGEYPATIAADKGVCTFKIKEVDAMEKIVATMPDPREVTAGETLKVRFDRVGGTYGSIAVKVKTQTSTAIMVEEFDYVKEILTWADGDGEPKFFEVPTKACTEVREDRQLRLKLSTLATGSYAGNIVPTLPESKIYYTIRNQIKVGKVVVAGPRTVRAGDKIKVRLSRVGGSSGSIAVKVKTQSSTAIMGVDGSAEFDYNKQVLEWADGDAEDKFFEVQTYPCAKFEPNRQFRLKLATMATGVYAGNRVPTLPESKVYFTIWNQNLPMPSAGGAVARIASGTDAFGNPIADGSTIELVQGVYSAFTLGVESGKATTCQVVQGELPPGLAPYKMKIRGIPTKAGDYRAIVQVADGSVLGTGLELNFHVAETGLAYGTFNGVLVQDGQSTVDLTPRLGSLTFTASQSGALSAKVKVGAKSYTFTGTAGYDRLAEIPAEGEDRELVAELVSSFTLDNVPYVNTLTIKVADGDCSDLKALGKCAGSARLVLNVIGEDGTVQEDISYGCELLRDNSGVDEFVKALAGWAGYYTVALVPEGVAVEDGLPAGNGYLTMTVGEDGKAAFAGRLADSEDAVSASGCVALRGDLAVPESCALLTPVFRKTDESSFGGLIRMIAENGEAVVDSTSSLEWNKDGKSSSYDRQGFSIRIRPTGGYYDTIVNLQTHYLYRDFSVEVEPVAGLPAELLPADKTYTLDTMPHDVEARLEGNVLAVDSRVLTMKKDGKRVDFAASVNPWKVKTSFNRATGVVSGTFQAYSDGAASATIATCNHYGVLLMNRDELSPLDADVQTAGFGLLPVSAYWTLSIPFNVRFAEVDRDWSEAIIPADNLVD